MSNPRFGGVALTPSGFGLVFTCPLSVSRCLEGEMLPRQEGQPQGSLCWGAEGSPYSDTERGKHRCGCSRVHSSLVNLLKREKISSFPLTAPRHLSALSSLETVNKPLTDEAGKRLKSSC